MTQPGTRSASLLLAGALAGLVASGLLQRAMAAASTAFYSAREVPAPGAQAVALPGGCELFLYRGQEALAGLLAFLLLYLAYTLMGRVLVQRGPKRIRPGLLLGWSLLFLAIVLGPVPALRLAEAVAALYLVLHLPLGRGPRAALALLGVLVFLPTQGRFILEHNTGFFCPGTAPGGAGLEGWVSFPRLFVALALLVRTFRRVLWVALETREGRLEIDFPEFMLYFLGLPSLLGNAATPSPSHWLRSRETPEAPDQGARTVAWCLGAAPLVLTALVMAATFPSVRLLFPPCDVPRAGWEVLWPRFALTYLADFLFLLATEQASVGVARLFGYGLRDNYDRPLLASSVAEYWRRWNIFWREFLVAAFFYPVALDLARRQGGRRPWHLVVAAGVTFLWTALLTVLPLALLGGANPDIPWQRLAPSLAAYYGLEALAVAAGLWLEARPGPPRRTPAWVAVPATFLFMAAARTFLNPEFTLAEQVQMVAAAFGFR